MTTLPRSAGRLRRAPADKPTDARLNPAAIVLWRGAGVVQIELGARSIIVENVHSEHVAALLPRRGSKDRATAAASNTLKASTALDELREVLDEFGFLSPAGTADWTDLAPPVPAHLTPDLAALSTQFGAAAATLLRSRRQAAVAVHGTSRLASSVAATIASAGVGWVQLIHGGEVGAADACPGGLVPSDEGRRFGVAAVDAIRRAAPDVDTTPIPADRAADLVVLTDPGPVDSTVRASLHLDSLAHLVAQVNGNHGVIGPLVLPGVTSCLRCADLHRTDRDPAWPAMVVQLSARPRHRAPSDVALCVATAGIAASQALAYLDHQQPATLGGTLEWQLPDWRLRRRSWPSHHRCDCGSATGAGSTRQNEQVIVS